MNEAIVCQGAITFIVLIIFKKLENYKTQGFRVELQVSDRDKIGTRQGQDRQGNDRYKVREGGG